MAINNPYIPGDPYSYDLKWIVDEVKKAIELYTPLSQNFTDLYDYVHDYFDNLDLSSEVRQVLREMQRDGTLDNIIIPILNDYTTSIDNEIDVLTARMDTFASLPPGSTSGNAELLDIRVAADGTTYPSAGDAVRAQFTDVNNDLDALNGQMFKKKAIDTSSIPVENGYYRIVSNNIVYTALSAYQYIIIPATPGDLLFISSIVGAATQLYLAIFRDSNDQLLSGYKPGVTTGNTYYEEEPVVVPPGCASIILTSNGTKATVKKYDYTDGKVDDIEDDLFNLDSKVYKKTEIDISAYLVSGAYRVVNGNVQLTALPAYTSARIPCTPGDVFCIDARIPESDTLSLVVFVAGSNNIVCKRFKPGNNVTPDVYSKEPFIVPDQADYMLITSAPYPPTLYSLDPTGSEIDVVDGHIENTASIVYDDLYNGQMRDSMMNTFTKLKAGTLKWTILGDSITDAWDGHAQSGGGASDAAHGYAKIVARWLQAKYGNTISFTNNGTGGASVASSIPLVSQYIDGQNFDLVIIALGTNDWNTQVVPSTFETNMNNLINTIQQNNTAEIALIGIGYFDGWQPQRSFREKDYNDILYKIAKQRGFRFVNPALEMKDAIDYGDYTFADITLAQDPVHPNDTGHRIWADTAYKLFEIL